MHKFLVPALLALATASQAADLKTPVLPTKAPALVGYPYSSDGFYFGLGAGGSAAQAGVAGTGIDAMGASLDGIVGWQWKGGLDFIAIENIASYTNIGNSGSCLVAGGVTSCDVNNRFSDLVRAKFGFPITAITNALPNFSSLFPGLPALPAGTNGTQHPYVYAGAHIADVSADVGLMTGRAWTVQPEVGLGLMSQWQSGLVADVSAGCTFAQVGIAVGPGVAGGELTRKCTARVGFLY